MPPHELMTNTRRWPSTSDHIVGLFESTSPGSCSREAGISRAFGTPGDCPLIAATATTAMTMRLSMLDQRLEHFIRGHVGLQRRDRHVALFHRGVIRPAAVGMVFVER